jgi:hypothetical protein
MNTSTKPFRRAGAIVLSNLYLLVMSLYLAGCTGMARLTGATFVIDQLEYPTLARTQRILHARNVKAREKELELKAKERSERQDKGIAELERQHTERRTERQAHHKELVQFWNGMYHQARAKEIAAEAQAERERKQLERDEFEKRRRREQEMWDKAEKERLRVKEQERRELEIYYAKAQQMGTKALFSSGGLTESQYDLPDGSYGDRLVSVHGVYLRMQANKYSKILGTLSQYERVTVDGWTQGATLYNNPIWFHVKPTESRLGGWIWSGSLNNLSTSGLGRMSDEIKQPNPLGSITVDMIKADKLSGTEVSLRSQSFITWTGEEIYR